MIRAHGGTDVVVNPSSTTGRACQRLDRKILGSLWRWRYEFQVGELDLV